LATLLRAADLGIPIENSTPEDVEKAIEIALAVGLEELREKGATGAEWMNSTRSWSEIGRQTVHLYARLKQARY
jgi:hypothetical protein